jgi:class 3 adenylate cyclase
MMKVPGEVRYVESGGGYIAYLAVGDGPMDLVHVPNWVSHVEAAWEVFPRFLRGLSTLGRLIMFDQRGVGLSDPLVSGQLPTLEEWMDQVRVVLDAVGSERPVLVGDTAGGMLATLFAATHPERVEALVVIGSCARYTQGPGYPWGWSASECETRLGDTELVWGSDEHAKRAGVLAFPSAAHDEDLARRWTWYSRQTCGPRTAATMLRLLVESDIRHVLPTIRVPTLVIHQRGDAWVPVDHGRYLAANIPGARYVELAGTDHFPVTDRLADELMDEISEFLQRGHQRVTADRMLTTIVFTDIVDSTRRSEELGDHAWTALLDEHDGICRRAIRHHRGVLVKSTGDGVLAHFDGPARAVRCALELERSLRTLGLEIRAGVHTGEVERRAEDIGGIAVHIAARIQALAAPGQVLASTTVVDLVAGSGLQFTDAGTHTLKGIAQPQRLLAVR